MEITEVLPAFGKQCLSWSLKFWSFVFKNEMPAFSFEINPTENIY